MLTFEEAEKVWDWYCSVHIGEEYTKEILQSIGLISTHKSGIVLVTIMPATSYLKIVDSKKFFLTKIKLGI